MVLFLSLRFPVACPTVTKRSVSLITGMGGDAYGDKVDGRNGVSLNIIKIKCFSSGIAPRDCRPNKGRFAIAMSSYTLRKANSILGRLRVSFETLDNIVTTNSERVFTGRITAKTGGINIILFSVRSPAGVFGIVDSTKGSHSICPMVASTLRGSS